MHSVRTVRIRRIAYVPQGVMAFHACMPPPHPIIPSKFQPTSSLFLHLSVSFYKCPFRGGFKDSGSSTDGAATRKVCAIHSLQRSVVNISGKSIPSPPPPRILLSKDLLLLSTMLGQSHTGPSSAKTACSNGHLEAGLGTLPREINCFSGLPGLTANGLQLQTFLLILMSSDDFDLWGRKFHFSI